MAIAPADPKLIAAVNAVTAAIKAVGLQLGTVNHMLHGDAPSIMSVARDEATAHADLGHEDAGLTASQVANGALSVAAKVQGLEAKLDTLLAASQAQAIELGELHSLLSTCPGNGFGPEVTIADAQSPLAQNFLSPCILARNHEGHHEVV